MNGDTNITFVESFTKEVGFLKKAVTPDELWMNFKSFLAIIELPHWLMGLLQWSRSQYVTPPGPNVNVYDEQWYSHLQNQLKVFLIFTQQVTLISYIYWQQLMWSASVPIMYVHLKKLSVVCFNILKWIEIKLNQNILVRFKHLHWLFLLHFQLNSLKKCVIEVDLFIDTDTVQAKIMHVVSKRIQSLLNLSLNFPLLKLSLWKLKKLKDRNNLYWYYRQNAMKPYISVSE